MENLTKFNEIVNEFNDELFVLNTIQQINKDLTSLTEKNIEVKKTDLNNLVSILSLILIELDKNRSLQQFIYLVDLKENTYIENLSKNDNLQSLAFEVIKKEAQKVFFRRYFQKK